MTNRTTSEPWPAVKDEERERPVASAWRPVICEVVRALVERDDERIRKLPGVTMSVDSAEQIRAYLDGYGETLIELPEESWNSSVAQWYGPHWAIMVDLWTAEAGGSDMILQARVFEDGDGFRFEVDMVYVP